MLQDQQVETFFPSQGDFSGELVMTEGENETSEVCAVLGIDHSNLFYRACSDCEQPLKDVPDYLCEHCHQNRDIDLPSSLKRFFRVLMSVATDKKVMTVICFDRVAKVMFGCSADEFLSVATDKKVMTVICFDRVAKVMFGCSADEFFDVLKFHAFAATTAAKVLEGEIFVMKLSKPKKGNAQQLQVMSLVPMMSDHRPAVEILKEVYKVRNTASEGSMDTST